MDGFGARTVRVLLALMFAAAAIGYSILWMRAVQSMPNVELGFDETYVPGEQALAVKNVLKDSPAAAAGMLRGDRIVEVDGDRISSEFTLANAYRGHNPGDAIQLSVARNGEAKPAVLTGIFRARHSEEAAWTWATHVRNAFPVPFVLVGLTVLFLRLEDPVVWLLALLFSSFAATPGFPDDFASVPPGLRGFAVTWRALAMGLLGPMFYFFFATFPVRSWFDRRWPWLKWAGLVLGALLAIDIQPRPPLARLIGPAADAQLIIGAILPFVSLGLIVLAHNYTRAATLDARRRIRVFFWGTVVGVGPSLIGAEAEQFGHLSQPEWLSTTLSLVMFLFPLSFAYAVVKHKVLEIPVLLKRSARYLLVQRGFLALLSLGSIGLTLLFAMWFARYLRPVIEMAESSSIALGAVFGTALLWGGSQVHKKVSGRIDKAFFHAAYDARMILEDLTEKTRTATDTGELARILEGHLNDALQPSSLAIYLEDANRGGRGTLTAVSGDVPPGLATLSVQLPALVDLAHRGRPSEAPDSGPATGLEGLRPDCLVPILGRGVQLVGLVVLGPRRSEEPYSGEDLRLLASVGSQAGTALENIRLARELAERMERERRTAREMEIAKDVQSRLLPQTAPRMKTIECAAQCVQARSVGGDYYDFLDLGGGRLALILGDVSGKGVHAALLVANLQANLRSQSAVLPRDPLRVLRQVNEVLWKLTAPQHYATLFFGIYDDGTRQLEYVNCGHNPPLWLRSDGSVEHLDATATVIGLFEKWDGTVAHAQLASGDLLAIFSDGVTEETVDGEDFGEARLLADLQANRRLPLNEMISSVFSSVKRFSACVQSDDLTLLVARAYHLPVTGTSPATPP